MLIFTNATHDPILYHTHRSITRSNKEVPNEYLILANYQRIHHVTTWRGHRRLWQLSSTYYYTQCKSAKFGSVYKSYFSWLGSLACWSSGLNRNLNGCCRPLQQLSNNSSIMIERRKIYSIASLFVIFIY